MEFGRTNETESLEEEQMVQGRSEAVFFINATPNRSLAYRYSYKFKKAGLQITVVERAETTTKKMLVKSNLFKEVSRKDPKCFVCTRSWIQLQRQRFCLQDVLDQGTIRDKQICSNISHRRDTFLERR